MVFLPKFDVAKVIEAMPRASILMGVPTFYVRLLKEPSFTREISAAMRLFISGSAPLLEETFSAFEGRTGHKILERYGMTESNMLTSNPLDGERRLGSVGPALPDVSMRIAGENGNILGSGEPGGVEVKGPNVFSGYWRMPEKTSEEFCADGYFRTGDLGCLAPDGYLTLVGRAKDLIISGGFNIYPKEVELLIDELDGVTESAVVGVPHPDFGEGVVAVVVAGDVQNVTEESISNALAAQLAGYKRPKRVFFVPALPRNAMGKVQKNVLRESYRATFA
jgi:malonyl-CoA/methylmalonyl-CoA synthetase